MTVKSLMIQTHGHIYRKWIKWVSPQSILYQHSWHFLLKGKKKR